MLYEAAAWTMVVGGLVLTFLTRLRLAHGGGGHSVAIGVAFGAMHTVLGIMSSAFWAFYMLVDLKDTPNAWMGWLGLLLISWPFALTGMVLLLRWMPAEGRHAEKPRYDTWSQGPLLSWLTHLTVLVGVMAITFLYLGGKI